MINLIKSVVHQVNSKRLEEANKLILGIWDSVAEKCGWVVDVNNWINVKRFENGDEEYFADICVCDVTTNWNPFKRSENAFSLAVKFGIGFRFNIALNQAFAWTVCAEDSICVNAEDFKDPQEAVRYAIAMCVFYRI